ncbi:DUF2975 domain-containing protein [Erythrobacter sp. HA6-11]
MSTLRSDPLLTIAGGLIWFILGVIVFCGAILTIAIPGVLIFGAEFVQAAELGPLTINMRLIIACLLAMIVGLLYLGWRFFRAMQAIVRSVGEGDPFVPANADRLTEMAWITLAVNIIALPLAGLAVFIASTVGENPGTTDVSLDPGGILLILTLFILSRVFRKGTEMRDDLEGTV